MKIIDKALLSLFGLGVWCAYCGKRAPGLDPHHLWAKGLGAGSRLDISINLIGLDRRCHTLVHAGKIKKAALLAIVAKREGTTPEAITDEINRLLRLPKGATP